MIDSLTVLCFVLSSLHLYPCRTCCEIATRSGGRTRTGAERRMGKSSSLTASSPKHSIPVRISARRTVAGPGAGIAGVLLILLIGMRHESVEGK